MQNSFGQSKLRTEWYKVARSRELSSGCKNKFDNILNECCIRITDVRVYTRFPPRAEWSHFWQKPCSSLLLLIQPIRFFFYSALLNPSPLTAESTSNGCSLTFMAGITCCFYRHSVIFDVQIFLKQISLILNTNVWRWEEKIGDCDERALMCSPMKSNSIKYMFRIIINLTSFTPNRLEKCALITLSVCTKWALKPLFEEWSEIPQRSGVVYEHNSIVDIWLVYVCVCVCWSFFKRHKR